MEGFLDQHCMEALVGELNYFMGFSTNHKKMRKMM